MNVHSKLFVEIHPYEGPHQPYPNPVTDGKFDPNFVYKVIGVYNPSETSECYFTLVNPARQIWFIPQRHLLAYRLIDSDEFYLPKDEADSVREKTSSSDESISLLAQTDARHYGR